MDLLALFTREAIIRSLKGLPPLKSPVIDEVYPNRPTHPLPVVGMDEIFSVAEAMPVTRRGGQSISATSGSGGYMFIEPLPVNIHDKITGADLNNLKMLDQGGLQTWAKNKTDLLRRSCRKTTEGIAAQSLTGKIEWPVQLDNGGFESYVIEYGTPYSVILAGADLWSDANCKIKNVFQALQGMQAKLQEQGYGGTVDIWASRTAYFALFGVAEKVTSTAKIRVDITEQGINIGGYLVKLRSETYRNPQTKSQVPIIADGKICMIAKDAETKMPYCAIDDLDANLQAMPFFIKPVKTDDPSGYKLIAQSKPLPIPNVKGLAWATVL